MLFWLHSFQSRRKTFFVVWSHRKAENVIELDWASCAGTSKVISCDMIKAFTEVVWKQVQSAWFVCQSYCLRLQLGADEKVSHLVLIAWCCKMKKCCSPVALVFSGFFQCQFQAGCFWKVRDKDCWVKWQVMCPQWFGCRNRVRKERSFDQWRFGHGSQLLVGKDSLWRRHKALKTLFTRCICEQPWWRWIYCFMDRQSGTLPTR